MTPPSVPIDDYRASGFAGSVGVGERPAVLVIDLARAYTEDGSALRAPVEDAVAACGRLVDAARGLAVPVIFTRVEYQVDPSTGEIVDGGLFVRKIPSLRVFAAGSPLGEFVDEPRPRPGEVVVTKQYASAFSGTPLAATLAARRIDSLVICGLSTSGCVRATATDAIAHGFAPTVVADACGDRTAAIHDANLLDLQAKYADVVTCDEAIALLGGGRPT
ncbi:isochorismatase family protein [Williamsia deligens]|uniref:Isochorismatase family protein n=1 Tax=Williamsia deligens TaxID=321325 RepID=A0ABW3G2T6_9NOCA|nr:isochorismatase family protein [Williamsia deligens]MCP2194943.1 maleamate amidohydrolase [Williamsia deligens]